MTNTEWMRLVIAEARSGIPPAVYMDDLTRVAAVADRVCAGEAALMPTRADGSPAFVDWRTGANSCIHSIAGGYGDASMEAVLMECARIADTTQAAYAEGLKALADNGVDVSRLAATYGAEVDEESDSDDPPGDRDTCPCGSGSKYQYCCKLIGDAESEADTSDTEETEDDVADEDRRKKKPQGDDEDDD